MKRILIYVLKAKDGGVFDTLYKNAVEWNDDLQFPFEKLYSCLKLLYPKADFIEFKLSTL